MMVKSGRAGVSDPASEGERLERRRQQRKIAILAGLALVGGIGGGIVGAQQGDNLFDLSRPWPPLLCLILAIAFLLAVIAGSIAMSRQFDEVEIETKRKAATAAARAFGIGYPLWFLLWKGGFLPEPMHIVLYGLFLVATLGATAFYRFRYTIH